MVVASAESLVWLAYRVATAPWSSPGHTRGPSLVGEVLLGAANPNVWAAVTPHFAGTAAIDTAAKGAVPTLMIILTRTAWLTAGPSVACSLRDSRRAPRINSALAAALCQAVATVHGHTPRSRSAGGGDRRRLDSATGPSPTEGGPA